MTKIHFWPLMSVYTRIFLDYTIILLILLIYFTEIYIYPT